jgi:hypothetical protein
MMNGTRCARMGPEGSKCPYCGWVIRRGAGKTSVSFRDAAYDVGGFERGPDGALAKTLLIEPHHWKPLVSARNSCLGNGCV